MNSLSFSGLDVIRSTWSGMLMGNVLDNKTRELHTHACSTAVSSMQCSEFHLARQPILDRDLQLAAFELLFRAAPGQRTILEVPAMAATATVISHAWQLGLHWVVGDQLAFVNVDTAFLMSDLVRFLPRDKVVIELLETVQPTPRVLARMVELKAVGFRFALDDVIAYTDLVRAFLPLVEVVKIDLRSASREHLVTLAQRLRASHYTLLAEKVESAEEFQLCLDLGFDYFQGYHLSHPTVLSGQKMNPSAVVLLNLLHLLRAGASTNMIEEAVGRDLSLRCSLLCLSNNDFTGTAHERIESVAQALDRIGRSRLRLWIEILLAAVPVARTRQAGPALPLDCGTPAPCQQCMPERQHSKSLSALSSPSTMEINMFSRCSWLHQAPAHRVGRDNLRVTTGDRTDFWRITSYGFIRDDGHFFAEAVDGGFTAQVHVRAAFQALYDQAGLMVRVDERHWLKAGIEFSDGMEMLSTVLTDEQSDWATSAAPLLQDGFWVRVTVDQGVIRVQYSADGIRWPVLRLAPFPCAERYLVGPMCCSPRRAGLEVEFSEFTLGPPLGKALHDLS